MRSLYKNQLVDYNEGKTEFVIEFNEEIKKNGAIVYNHTTNTYQFITRFEEIEFINELGPCFFRVTSSMLPNGIDIEMAYDFNPADYADDEEITNLWAQAVAEGQSVYDYYEDGEVFEKEIIPLSNKPTKHTIWLLNDEGHKFIFLNDELLILPMIKYLDIAKKVIREYTIEPFN